MDSCTKTPSQFVLFDNVILHVLILFIIISALFVFLIFSLSDEHINGEFVHIIDKFADPSKIKQVIQNKTSPDKVKELLISLLNINIKNNTQAELLDKITDYITNKLPDNNTSVEFLNKIINDYNKNEHPLRTEINNNVKIQMCMIIAFFVILVVIINLLPGKMGNYCGVLKHLSVELLVIFTFVGIIEFWFFTNVASKYVPVDPTIIISTFKKKVKDKLF